MASYSILKGARERAVLEKRRKYFASKRLEFDFGPAICLILDSCRLIVNEMYGGS